MNKLPDSTIIEKARRGRPRQYEHAVALGAAVDTFWRQGFSATTFDDLVLALGMNKPSLYRAFGDKSALYAQALQHFVDELRVVLEARVIGEPDLRRALQNLFADALAVYCGPEPALGCFVFCTAPVEAVTQPQIREVLEVSLKTLDQLLARRFRMAQKAGQFPVSRSAASAGQLTQAVLHSLAIRARAGEPRAALARLSRAAVTWLVDDQPPRSRRATSRPS